MGTQVGRSHWHWLTESAGGGEGTWLLQQGEEREGGRSTAYQLSQGLLQTKPHKRGVCIKEALLHFGTTPGRAGLSRDRNDPWMESRPGTERDPACAVVRSRKLVQPGSTQKPPSRPSQQEGSGLAGGGRGKTRPFLLRLLLCCESRGMCASRMTDKALLCL